MPRRQLPASIHLSMNAYTTGCAVSSLGPIVALVALALGLGLEYANTNHTTLTNQKHRKRGFCRVHEQPQWSVCYKGLFG
jgi:hypothetical protein